MKTLIKGGRVIDPASGKDGIFDILINDNLIEEVSENIELKDSMQIIDATGCFVMPGLVDLHVHFREPGFEYKETIKTGSMAAAAGGVTSVVMMPNTKPVIDSVQMLEKVNEIIQRDACVNIFPCGAVTLSQQGKQAADIAGYAHFGIKAISEDGKSVMDSGVYREAMKEAAANGITVLAHCEDINLVRGGSLNAGKKAEELGVNGISNAVEDIIAARDILLAKETGARLHLCHCSTADSVEMVLRAREEGLPVTAEACPHHFILCDEDIPGDDANYKMNPPLRSRKDLLAIREGLKKDIITVISTDHAPHSAEEKSKPIAQAPFGIVGIETSLALTYTELVLKGVISLKQMVEKMSLNPSKVIGIDRGTLLPGKTADIVIMDPGEEYEINAGDFKSKGTNTPFIGRKVKGRVRYTLVAGQTVYRKEK